MNFYLSRNFLSVKNVVILSFFAMLLASVMIPSDGNHGVFSIKSLSFLSTGFSIVFYIFSKGIFRIANLRTLAFFLLSITFLLLWAFISFSREETLPASTMDQFKIFLITISATIFSYFLIKEKIISYAFFLKTLVYGNFTYSVIKILFVILHLTGIKNIFDIMSITGLRFMSMDMGTGMIRMQTSIDIVTPFLIYFVLQKSLQVDFNKIFKYSYILISFISIFLSFSRVMIFIGFLSLALYWFTLKPSQIFRALSLFFILMCAGIVGVGVEKVGIMIEKRFFSDENTSSDDTRTIQIEALMEEHAQYPLLGKGLGSYSLKALRDDRIQHSYEVQWVAFLMQFGLTGILIILIPLTFIINRYLSHSFSRQRLAFITLFMCWLLAGFTNPFIISLTSGIIYSLFMLSAIQFNELREKNVA